METLLTIDALEAAARQCGRKGYVRIPFVGWVSAERLVKTCHAMRDAGASVAVKRDMSRTPVYAPGGHVVVREIVTPVRTRLAFSWNGGRGSLALIVLSEAPPVGCPVAILGASPEAADTERKATRRARGERAREMIACYAVEESEAA